MVSNGTGQCNFLGQRGRSFFIAPDKGTTGQAQKLAKGREGTWDGTITIFLSKSGWDRDRTEQSLFFCFRSAFPVLERPFSIFCLFLGKWFCPGTSWDRGVCRWIFSPSLCPGQGTMWQCDNGTMGQGIIFVSGQRDNGTSRLLETLVQCKFQNLTRPSLRWVCSE